jgi:mannitol 2-dehydrogenase
MPRVKIAQRVPLSRANLARLQPQDNLYILVERSAAQKTVSVIGSLTGVVFAGESSAALMEATDRRAIRIVSLTVTKHGYCLNRSAKQLDPDHPLIRQDLAHPERPSSTIGIVVEACRRQESRVPRRAPLREIHQPH